MRISRSLSLILINNMVLCKSLSNFILHAISVSLALVLLSNCTSEPALVEVEALTMSQTNAEIEEGASIQLYASITPSNATEKNVKWSSSKIAVATVSDGGLVSAVSCGTATITALAGAKTATCVITVVKAVIHVSSIELDKKNLTLVEGEQETLVPIIYPADATDKSVTWSSSQVNIATVEKGVVTAISPGNAKIVAKTQDGGKVAECELTVEKKLAPSVTVGASHITSVSACLVGRTNIEQLSASTEAGIAYSTSSSTLVASPIFCKADSYSAHEDYEVSVINLEPNTKYYYRSYISHDGENHYGDIQEFTTKELTSMVETMDASDIEATSAKLNAMIDLTDVKGDDLDYGFQWRQSDSQDYVFVKSSTMTGNIASTSISGLKHNTVYHYRAVVKINGKDYCGDLKEFTTGVVHVSSVQLNVNEHSISKFGDSFKLVATVLPNDATNKIVKWKTSDSSIASVGEDGLVTGKGTGKATITVTSDDGSKTDQCIVTVYQSVSRISLDNTSKEINEGESFSINASVLPENASYQTLTWSSDKPDIATVDANGLVKALSKGVANITASSTDGSNISATCIVTVKRLVTSIEINKQSFSLYTGASEQLVATVLPDTANDRSVTWSSSDNSVVSVNSSGLITALSKGNATITATANDGSGISGSCDVEVKQYVTSISLSQTGISCIPNTKTQLSAIILPENANDKTVEWTSSNTSVVTVDSNGLVAAKAAGTATIYVKAKDGSGVESNCTISIWNAPEAVDLGLSVKWASWNLGASSPSEGGDYFAWGEVLGSGDGKSNFDFYSYKWYEGQKSGTSGLEPEVIPKYNYDSAYGPVDNLDVLEAVDDAASTKLGGSWRMPTQAEFAELRSKCNWVWTTENGVAGMRITSKVSGHTDKSIFLPGAGNIVNTTYQSVGEHGSYWSSNIDHFTSYQAPYGAMCIHFGVSYYFLQASNRSCGFTIRAVTK